jgi:hypothetical protein
VTAHHKLCFRASDLNGGPWWMINVLIVVLCDLRL